MDTWQAASIDLGRRLTDSLADADLATDEGVARALRGQLAVLRAAAHGLEGITEPDVDPDRYLEWRRHLTRARGSVLAVLCAMAAGAGADGTQDFVVSMGWLIGFGLTLVGDDRPAPEVQDRMR